MVCHETYKDSNGKWLSPDEIEKDDDGNFIKKEDQSKVIVGSSESMSKSKKCYRSGKHDKILRC